MIKYMSHDLSRKRNGFLDLIKIIATILIVFHHFQLITGVYFNFINFYNDTFYFGRLVELFFMISGFLMTTYIPKIPEELSLRRFISKRYFRLIPVVAISTIIDFLLYISSDSSVFRNNPAGLIFETVSVALGFHAIFSVKVTYANNAMWYVSALIWCYVVFYFCSYLFKKALSKSWLLPLVVVVFGVIGLFYLFNYPFANGYTNRGYVSFFAGLIIGIIISKIKVSDKWLVPVSISVFTLSLIPVYYFPELSYLIQITSYIVFVCFAQLLFFSKTKVAARFDNSFLESMAKISFHVYCFHTPVIKLLYMTSAYKSFTLLHGFLSMIICTVIIYFVSFISYSVIEKPLVKFLKGKNI